MSKVMIEMNELIEEISMGPFGSDIKVDNFVETGVPVLNGSNVNSVRLTEESFNYVTPEKAKSLKKANAKRGDIVITHRGTLGQIAFIPENSLYDNYIISQSQFKVRLKANKVDPAYFTYYFHTNEGQKRLLSFKNHVGVPALAQATTNFRKLEFPLIPLFEQQKIAKVLSDLDAKIELNNKINSDLEAMAKTLYDYWFVQYDFPNVEGKPYKSLGGKMVWNEELKREIPEGWNVKKVEDLVADIRTGLNPRDHFKLGNGSNYYITIKNIEYGRIQFDNSCDRISDEAMERIQKRSNLEKGDILFTSIEPVGKTYLLSENPTNWNINESVFNFKPNLNEVSSEYLFMLLSSNSFNGLCKNASTGSIHKGIRITPIKAFKVVHPKIEIINEFTKIVSSYLSLIDKNQKENQELASLRDWLLPMLMNGQVSVGGYEVEDSELGMVAESVADYQANLSDKDKKIRRKILATYIINQSLNDTSFGKTKFEKLLHLIECHIVKGDYNQRYSVQAAGPYDGGFTKVFWNEVTKSKWFKIEEFGRLKRIMPAENHSKSLVDYGFLSEDLKLMINNFIADFKNTNYERPEIISTLYAVWNNRIIRNEMITDELLKKDFLEWDEQKSRYKDRLDKALEWMREKGIIPNGWGSEIKRAKK